MQFIGEEAVWLRRSELGQNSRFPLQFSMRIATLAPVSYGSLL